MTKNSWLVGGLVAAALATVIACTKSSTPNGSTGGDGCTYDLAQELQVASGAGDTCASCIQSSCSSEVSAYEGSGGCGAYFSCVCPGGTATTNQTTIEGCASQQDSACTQSEQTFSTCVDTSCATQCKTGSSSGSGSSSGGGSGSSSGSSSGGSSGSSSGGGANGFCVVSTASECTNEAPYNNSADCTATGGTVVTSCSTAGLVGCCTISGANGFEACFYSGLGEDAGTIESSCTAENGTFSSSP